MGEQLTLGSSGSWVRGLEREFALKLVPHMGIETAKELAADMAKLAVKRAEKAGVASSFEVPCGGCGSEVSSEKAAFLCSKCAKNTMIFID